jgi:DNA-directed RNA polymerase subunit M/transcription elongation factor TFIIS
MTANESKQAGAALLSAEALAQIAEPDDGSNLLITRNGTKRVCRACKHAYERRTRNTDTYRAKHALQERLRRAK